MKIKLKPCDVLENWFLIVRVEHDGSEWTEKHTSGCNMHMCAERLHPAGDLEGPADIMVHVAEAIKKRGKFSSKRVAVEVIGSTVRFTRPKNPEVTTDVTLEEADELADQILKEFVII